MAIENIANLGSIDLPNGEKAVVDLDRINGRVRVQVRNWYSTDDGWKPGRNGITFSPAEWEQIRKMAPTKDQLPKDEAKPTSTGTGRSF